MEIPKWVNDLWESSETREVGIRSSSSLNDENDTGAPVFSESFRQDPAREEQFGPSAAVTVTASPHWLKEWLSQHVQKNDADYTINDRVVSEDDRVVSENKRVVSESDLKALISAVKKLPDQQTTALTSLLNNLRPRSALLQLVTLLECTAILSAIWLQKPDFNPNKGLNTAVYGLIALFAYSSVRNIHYYASVLNHVKPEDIHAAEHAVALFSPIAALVENKPRASLRSRTEQDARSFLSYFIKLAAAGAVFAEELRAMPLAMQMTAAFLGGSVEGIDTAFTQVAIGNEHREIADILSGRMPLDNAARSGIFPRIANFPLIPWMMAKVGPAMWAVVKARAAVVFMSLVDLDSSAVPGGLYGFYAVAALSAAYVSTVFSQYNVDHNLGCELPTQRDFLYSEKRSVRFAQAALGAMPVAAAAAYAGHVMGASYEVSGAVGFAAELAVVAALTSSKRVADHYRSVAEFRFVSTLVNKVDRLHVVDQGAIASVGAMLWAFCATRDGLSEKMGESKVLQMSAALGMMLAYVGCTGVMAAHSRMAASQVRYATVQMFLYAAAMLTWILNAAMPMHNMLSGVDPADHPTAVNMADFGKMGYFGLLFASLAVGYLAGTKDHAANASGVKDADGNAVLTEAVPAAERSMIGRFFTAAYSVVEGVFARADHADRSGYRAL